MRIGLLVSSLLVLAALAWPAAGHAAQRQVPRGWLGVMADGPLLDSSAGSGAEWDLLAASGPESVRVAVSWARAQPTRGAAPDLAGLDATILSAAQRGLDVLPVVLETPSWAATQRKKGIASPPRHPADFGAFLRVLVGRYGPRGTLWAEHPEVPVRAVRDWQIWNEPNLRGYWDPPRGQGFAHSYVNLLKASRRALRGADRGAHLILAGLPNRSWPALASLYKAGARGSFDAVAIHPYTGKTSNVLRLVRYARQVTRRYHDGHRPIWLTELSWPASVHHVRDTTGFTTTESGQASRLRDGLQRLAAQRKTLGIGRVYWYTWLSSAEGKSAFAWSGLRRLQHGRVVSARSLSAYRSVARRLEGCAKRSGNARRCR